MKINNPITNEIPKAAKMSGMENEAALLRKVKFNS